jgi:tRNA(adenine34) deaminase
MADDHEPKPALTVFPIPVDRPSVLAFRLSGVLSQDDVAFMGAIANQAFDTRTEVDMILIFEPEARISLTSMASATAIRAEFRALGKVRRYVAVGAPAAVRQVISAMDAVIPPDARTFARDEEPTAWDHVTARPLTPPPDISRFEWEAMAAVNARAHLAAREAGRAGIAAAVLRGDRMIALEANEIALQCDPTRHAEGVAMAAAGKQLGGPDLSGCTLLSSLQPCEMCLAASRFAGIDRILFAVRQQNVPGRYFVFPGLGIDDFIEASPRPFTAIGGLQEDDVLPLYADGQE